MKVLNTFLLILIFLPLTNFAQFNDNCWMTFEYYSSTIPFKGNKITFNSGFPETSTVQQELAADFVTLANICDSLGNFKLYSNGVKILNQTLTMVENGDSINFQSINDGQPAGYSEHQGLLILPKVNESNHYGLFHVRTFEYLYPESWHSTLLYTEVDLNANNGVGKVTTKAHELVHNIGNFNGVTACKHANGRDWWVMVPHLKSGNYYTFLYSVGGVVDSFVQNAYPDKFVCDYENFNYDSCDVGGWNCFTPNGKKFIDFDIFGGIRVFDFDRCTGSLSNIVNYRLPDIPPGSGKGGVAVSPNSRFLYASYGSKLFQMDLNAMDVLASLKTISVYDGFVNQWGQQPDFGQLQLMPDGRIYIGNHAGDSDYLHVVNFPDRAGLACALRLRGLHLPNRFCTACVNYPNFRLGPLDGTACDSLGLDNHPLARWRQEMEDTLAPLRVTFTDYSAYEPATWHWDFAGLGMSSDTNPVFEFPQAGTYHVCLSVCNQYACDTLCREVPVGGVSGTAAAATAGLEVFPNPALDAFFVKTGFGDGFGVEMVDMLGREALRKEFQGGGASVPVSGLAAGLYWLRIVHEGRVLGVRKMVVTR